MSPVRPEVRVAGRGLDPEHHRPRDLLTRAAQPHRWLERRIRPRPLLVRGARACRPTAAGRPRRRRRSRRRDLRGARRAPGNLLIRRGSTTTSSQRRRRPGRPGSRRLRGLRRNLDGRDRARPARGQASHTSLIEELFGFPTESRRRARTHGRAPGRRLRRRADHPRGVVGSRLGSRRSTAVELAGHRADQLRDPGCARDGAAGWPSMTCSGAASTTARGGASRQVRERRGRRGRRREFRRPGGLNLAHHGVRQIMLVRGDDLGKSMSAYLVERIERSPAIDGASEPRQAHAG